MPYEATAGLFSAALTDPASPPPTVTQGRLGVPDARRFSVYRNNVAVGLIRSLEARYPVSRQIAGVEGFREIARAYLRFHKPRSPVMIAYGADFPDFLRTFTAQAGPQADRPHLADVARLENAWVEAYHAEDAPVATIRGLDGLGAADLPQTRIEFHSAAFLMRFATPAGSIWAAQQDGAQSATPADPPGEDVLITRPEAEVMFRVLPPAAYDFGARLREGATLLEAAHSVNSPDFDFGAQLVGLVEAGAVASVIRGEPE